jgi:hypothetical protein
MHNKILSRKTLPRRPKVQEFTRTAPSGAAEIQSTRRLEKSRIAILNGWIIAMIGVACYCVAMLGNETRTDPFSSIFERGMTGWAAVLFTTIGLGLWLVGCVGYLKESEQVADQEDDCSND